MSSTLARNPIGIDLGTTYTKVAVVQNGKVKVLDFGDGNYRLPSCVYIADDGLEIVGEKAKAKGPYYPKNCIFDVKRIIGAGVGDPAAQADIKHFPFDVVEKNAKYQIRIGDKHFLPEEISAKVLAKAKEVAKKYTTRFNEAVITVPANFGDRQKAATLEAARLAGLKVLRLLVEPTAAAVALAHARPVGSRLRRRLVVFDFGGGTLDVSALEATAREQRVLAIGGDAHLGGVDMDRNLADHYARAFRRRHPERAAELDANDGFGRLASLHAESRKIALSTRDACTLEMADLDFRLPVTRARFDELNAGVYERARAALADALAGSGLATDDVDAVALVGGSSRVPGVRDLVADFFGGGDPEKLAFVSQPPVEPDEAVVRGAALHAAVLGGDGGVERALLVDVLPRSIGVREHDGRVQTLLERNATLPARQSKEFRTIARDQRVATFPIVEGGHGRLAKLHVRDLPPGEVGAVRFVVEFVVDENGIFDASVREVSGRGADAVRLQVKFE